MVFLGYDGGGSKCAFLLVDENLNVLAEKELRIVDYPEESNLFAAMIRDGILAVAEEAGITAGEISFSCFAITGYGELAEQDRTMEADIREILGNDRFYCCHDGVGAWAGSLDLMPGINLIAGTGTVAYGRDRFGNEGRVGGWGFFCGDEGSAYWLGRRLLSIYTKEADGRLPSGAAYRCVREEFCIESDFAFRYGLCEEIWRDRAKVADLQRVLLKAAKEGDPAAVEAYRDAAHELAQIVTCLIGKLDFGTAGSGAEAEIPVSYSGGVFHAGELVLGPLEEELGPHGVKLVEPVHAPVYGAALLAREAAYRADC